MGKVVLAAVGQDGRALQYADQALRCDSEVVLAAVRQTGRHDQEETRSKAVLAEVCCCADWALWRDRDFVLAAVAEKAGSFKFVAGPLREEIQASAQSCSCTRKEYALLQLN